jgi:hypothetical protein
MCIKKYNYQNNLTQSLNFKLKTLYHGETSVLPEIKAKDKIING